MANSPPDGRPTVAGTAEENQTLTASVADVSDTDGFDSATVAYQWQRSKNDNGQTVYDDIADATSSTYTLTQADVGQMLQVVARYTDNQGTQEQVTSDPTETVTNLDDAPTGGPAVTGTAAEDEVLTATAGDLADEDGLGTITYTWQRTDAQGTYADIGDAQGNAVTGASYTLTQADVGRTVRAVASYTDGGGNFESADSTPTETVTNLDDAPTGGPTITGTAAEDGVLTAAAGDLADEDGLGPITYTWQRTDAQGTYADIGDAQGNAVTGASYTLTQADVGRTVRAVASYTDGGGNFESADSTPTDTVTNLDDAPTGAPAVTGTAVEDGVLTATAGDLVDEDGLGAVTYRWQRSDAQATGGYADIQDATGTSYTLTQADVGRTVRAVASYIDGGGNPEEINSDASAPVANVNDPDTGAPAVTGTARQGEMLTATTGTLDDPDGLGTISYRWQRADAAGTYADIVGATQASYTLTQADVGQTVRAVASYTDDAGTSETAESTASAKIENIDDPLTGRPEVTGTARQGEALTATAGDLADADGFDATEVTYRWQRSDARAMGGYADIQNATGTSYTLTQADVGQTVRAVASYTGGQSNPEEINSDASAPVANVNDPDTGAPAVTGTARQGETLTATTGTLDDPDGLDPAAVTYRWQRLDGQGDYADIAGAMGASYTLTQADVGQKLRAVASYTDRGGSAEITESVATAEVADLNDAPTGAPAVAGTARQGETLTATTGTLADADGLDSTEVTYRWQRSDARASGGYADIVGATSASYTLTQADVGRTVRAVASYTDNAGTDETVESAATAAVTADTPVTPDTPGTPVDTTAPDAPVVLGLGPRPGAGGLFVRGTAEAGSTVEVYQNARPLGTVTAGADEAWAVPLAGELDAGTYAFTATATDAAGNLSPTSSASTVAVEEQAPAGAEPTPVSFEAGARGVEVTRTEAGDLVVNRDGVTEVLRGTDELRFIDGRLVFDPDDAASQVARLYRAGLGRGVDQDGLQYWADLVEAGTPLGALAQGFLASPEGQALYGADSSNAEFVARLYSNVLGREGDEAGVAFWTQRLGEGATRADVLAAVADSTENRQAVAPQGVWDLDEDAARVARLYDAVFGRSPDQNGLVYWTETVRAGRATLEGMAEGFMASPEFRAVQSALSNTDFVRALYQNTLDRPGDEGGVDYWASLLDSGLSRAALVVSFSESQEHTALTAPDILGSEPGAFGIRLA